MAATSSNPAQDAILTIAGFRIERQTAEELVLRHLNGKCERFLAIPGLTFDEGVAMNIDGIFRDGVYYAFAVTES